MKEVCSTDELVALLQKLEESAAREAKGLPSWQDRVNTWEGFVFLINNWQLLASMTEIQEIIHHVPPITRVPGAKNWVRGVANQRGNLLPVMDLQQLCGGDPLRIDRRSRILVVDQAGVATGLLVSAVTGRKQFPANKQVSLTSIELGLQSFVESGFVSDGQEWPVFSVPALLAYPDYQSAAR
jgi:twitching motility protein PilI